MLFADLVGSTALPPAEDPERVRLRHGALLRGDGRRDRSGRRHGREVRRGRGDGRLRRAGRASRTTPSARCTRRSRCRDACTSSSEASPPCASASTRESVRRAARDEGSSFVTGDAVNVAARLEQAAAPGETLVGERTVAAVRGAFEFAEPRTVEAKGKAGGVACRRLVRALSLMRPRGVGGFHSAFVGREQELRSAARRHTAPRSRRARPASSRSSAMPAWARRASFASSGSGSRAGAPAAPAHGPLPPVRADRLLGSRRGAQGAPRRPRRRLARERAATGSATARCSGSPSGSTSPATCTR